MPSPKDAPSQPQSYGFYQAFFSTFVGMSLVLFFVGHLENSIDSVLRQPSVREDSRPEMLDRSPAAQIVSERKILRSQTQHLPASWIDFETRDLEASKQAGKFWSSGLGDHPHVGVALRVLENAPLFQSLFPGYEQSRSDANFWERYFDHRFELQRTWSPLLNEGSFHQSVAAAQGGWIDLHSKFGADILVFGSSEVFRGIVPATLAKSFQAPRSRDPKVLMCAESNVTDIFSLVEKLDTGLPKAKWAIWGYSAWGAFLNSQQLTERDEAGLFESVSTKSPLAWFLWQDFAPASWTSFYRVQVPRSPDHHLRPMPKPENEAYLWIAEDQSEENSILDTGLRARHLPIATPSNLRKALPLPPAACDMTRARAALRNSLQILRRHAERILLYIPPTTPFLERFYPKCYYPAVAKMLSEFAGKNVQVLTGRMDFYGLELKDYLYPVSREGLWGLNINHLNYEGADKVTRQLATVLQETSRSRN